MPSCPECGAEVEIGAIECPSCGVYPGFFPTDAKQPVVRVSTPAPIPGEPPFSFPLAALQALFAIFATLGLVWWAHGPIDFALSADDLIPDVALRLSRGFSIALPAVLLVGLWSAVSNRRDSWIGYGFRFVAFAGIAIGITLGPSYLRSREAIEAAAEPQQASALDPTALAADELPSTGIPALDARLGAMYEANKKMQELQNMQEEQMLGELLALEQPLGYSQRPSAPSPPRLDPDELAMCMTDRGAILYGTPWCGACKHQKRTFGSSIQFIDYVDCDSEPEYCSAARIRAYPTWDIAGRHYQGSRSLTELAKLSGCAPESLADYPEPSTAPSPMITRASYTWRDEKGTLHVTSEPPPPGAQKIEVVE